MAQRSVKSPWIQGMRCGQVRLAEVISAHLATNFSRPSSVGRWGRASCYGATPPVIPLNLREQRELADADAGWLEDDDAAVAQILLESRQVCVEERGLLFWPTGGSVSEQDERGLPVMSLCQEGAEIGVR